MLDEMDDTARGYERMADVFVRARNPTIGPDVLRTWSTQLPRGNLYYFAHRPA